MASRGGAGSLVFDVVIPTYGRRSLGRLLELLYEEDLPGEIVVVDDRSRRDAPLVTDLRVRVVTGRAAGPAAARNAGWRSCDAEWIAFLDDDVLTQPGWADALRSDLAAAAPDVAAVQGRIRVPLPRDRRPTDWERNVAGLETARWATADMAFRRTALVDSGGFDERFPRAYREDADLALRLMRAGWKLERGERHVVHPVRHADWRMSLRMQAGNADDVLMRRLHGPGWREQASAPRGRKRRHFATAAAGVAALGGAVRGARGAGTLGMAWLAGTAELAWARISPGPKTPGETAKMIATSTAMPFAASYHTGRGLLLPPPAPPRPAPEAVLFDRDGTLVRDIPYNTDPAAVRPMPGAREALDRLRRAHVPLAVVSNQSGIARGLISPEQVDAVNARIEELLGPIGTWVSCPHGPDDGCDCRKPRPGLVLRAARMLGVPPERCAVVGDIGADVEAARAAGARPVLVPTEVTRPEEVASAPEIAASLEEAVERLIGADAR